MRVKAVCNLGTNDYSPDSALREGEEGDVEQSVGVKMVARGHAVEIEHVVAPAEVAQEVPEQPAVDKPKPKPGR